MSAVKAPFNFAPLPQHVFFPKWADVISQDIPFEDGVSGSISLTVKAETPLFIRNGHCQGTKDNTFSHTPDGKYFIPATSIKGCIRNVLEIMGFCKMNPVTEKKGKYKTSPGDWEKKRLRDSADEQGVSFDHYDLSECIFGSVKKEKALKGRVQFTNLICTKAVQMPDDKQRLIYVLNTPNPDCLPLYVQGGQGYDNDERYAEEYLNGWKRYILKNGVCYQDKKERESKTTSTFCPLNRGSEFQGKILFHNLLPQELGALLCALTWCGKDNHYHQIGLAKPYGFGRISITVNWQKGEIDRYLEAFLKMMNDWLGSLDIDEKEWNKTLTIWELFTNAGHVANYDDKDFRYMASRDIGYCKSHKESLDLLSKIIRDKQK